MWFLWFFESLKLRPQSLSFLRTFPSLVSQLLLQDWLPNLLLVGISLLVHRKGLIRRELLE